LQTARRAVRDRCACRVPVKGRRLIHLSCFGDDGDLMVYQVWESPESFEAFGATLMPILAVVGIDPGKPDTMVLHRLEQASASQTT
jgi:hypothetical protein